MSYWGFGLVALGLAINVVSLVLVVIRLFRIETPPPPPSLQATLILPLSGGAPGLESLVRALERQQPGPRRLLVAVESQEDPAYTRALAVAAGTSLAIEVVVAGLASHQAQKCRNLQAALARVDERDDAVVLLDGDILPTSSWLGGLIAPIAGRKADVVTGARWQLVSRNGAGPHLVAAIDRAAFLLPRFRTRYTRVAWGGSVALSRRALATMRLSDSLADTLSDDLALVDAAKSAGFKVVSPEALLVPSPASLGLGASWRFGTRQYQIIRIYRPWLWRLAAATLTARLAAWGVILSGIFAGLSDFGLAAVAMTVLAVAKQALVLENARRVGLCDPPGVTGVQLALSVVQPLVDLFHLSLVLGSVGTRRVVWGHVTYIVDGPRAVRVVARRPAAG